MGGSNLMSAIAGRVLLIPKGNYDSTATYTMLDMVVYNGSSYICKQECTGVVPTNTTYWMLNASGSAVAYINDIGDVVITNVSNGQVLMYDSTTQKWVNGTITTTLAGLTDTQIASLSNGQVLKYNSTSQKWENAEDTAGILPHLIIISETGESVVKAVKGTTEIIATETSTGHYECDVPEFGTWTIHAVLNGDDAQVSLVVDTVKVYTVDDSHFHASVTVTYPIGSTCGISGQGETYYATTDPYTFTVHHTGTYTLTCTLNNRSATKTVTITTDGQTESVTFILEDIYDGSTITPVNDIQTWLSCGGITGKSYTTLNEVLADSTTLMSLIASQNACDYLVRSTSWVSGICGNQNAMSYIGLNNYCANLLIADSTWLDGIANSNYIESVMNVKVPTMTGDTTPSGLVFYTSQLGMYSGKNWSMWTAFDGNKTKTNGWNPTVQDTVERGGYQFISPNTIKIIHFMFKVGGTNSGTNNLSIKFIGSNDGTNWVDLTDAITISGNYDGKISIPNNVQYDRYAVIKVKGNINSSTGNWYYVPYIQFYGREDV